jgi:hypothetical protein
MTVDSRKTRDGGRNAEALERVVDRTIRELLDVEPRADFRARVIERLERRDASVGRVFRPRVKWTWVLAPIAAAAVVLLAVVLWRPVAMPQPRRTSDVVLRAPASLRGRSDGVPAPTPVGRIARQASVRHRTHAAAFASPQPARPTIVLDPLGSIDAISVAPVALQSLEIPQIGIRPLAPIAAIEIDPVNPSAGRN